MRGTVILSNLCRHGVVVVVAGTGGRRGGKVGLSWRFGPSARAIVGRGLLVLRRRPLPDARGRGSGNVESARGRAPEEGIYEEANLTS